MFDQFLSKAAEMLASGQSFAIAEVVHSLKPVSGKSGDKAIISADGAIWGWIGMVFLVFALGKIITELPAALSRRVDPRSSLSLVWGRVSAGSAPNAIPDVGVAEGTVRCLDDSAWHAAPELLKTLVP